MAKLRAVGIDLGTTFSCVAWMPESSHTAMVTNSDGDILTPSVVLFEDRETIVGKEAKKAGALKVGRIAETVKRDMGSPVYSRPIRGEYLPPEVIQAFILRKLKADVLKTVGPDHAAVITIPAFFDEPRRSATAQAGEMAGLNLLDIVNEPTAAALAFGEELGYLTPKGDVHEAMNLLVYDLGGGTFDVTIVEMRPGVVRIIATDGDVRLGGYDWDMRLVDLAAREFMQVHREDPRQNPVSLHLLLREAEEAKHTLSTRGRAKIRVEHAGITQVIEVTREQFEEATADLLGRTAHTTKQVLQAAGLAWKDIARVLLVGGSTRMPMIERTIEGLSGLKPNHAVHPDEAVARGAAIYAHYLMGKLGDSGQVPRFVVTNCSSHSLGIEAIDPQTMRKRNVFLIPRYTPLPAKAKREFGTRRPGQPSVVVNVLEGESSLATECSAIGRTAIRDLPTNLPAGAPIDVVYEYNTNGRLMVTAQVRGVGKEVQLQLERDKALSDERVAKWKRVMGSQQDVGLANFEDLVESALKDFDLTRPGTAAQTPAGGARPIPLSAAGAAKSGAVTSAGTSQAAAKPKTDDEIWDEMCDFILADLATANSGLPTPTGPTGSPAQPAYSTPPSYSQPPAMQQPMMQRPTAQWANPVAPAGYGMTGPGMAPQYGATGQYGGTGQYGMSPGYGGQPMMQQPAMMQQPMMQAPTEPALAHRSSSDGAAGVNRSVRTLLFLSLHLMGATLGLALGYYVLCCIYPDKYNSFNLPLYQIQWATEPTDGKK